MVYCIIATVGQSVISNADKAAFEGAKALGRDKTVNLKAICDNQHDFPGKQWYDIVMASLFAKRNDVGLLRAASAELNHLVPTLQGAAPHKSDELHFLASETADGVLAARILKDFCEAYFQRKVDIHIIEGLQVEDGERFRRIGLRSLIATAYKILQKAPAGTYQRIINPTGGFKGVVPYLTLIGMLQGDSDLEISYIFESSRELIRLSGLPLRFDMSAIEAAYEVLDLCETRASGLTESELQEQLEWQEQPLTSHPLWALFEPVDGKYLLSDLGLIFHQQLKAERSRTLIWLSTQAEKALSKFDKNLRETYGKILNQMTDEQWRNQNLHATLGKKCKVLKATDDERVFFFEEEDNSILVVELARHSDGSYERLSKTPPVRKIYNRSMRWAGQGTKNA